MPGARWAPFIAAVAVSAAAPAMAQVTVDFEPGGRVTVIARDAPVQDVLAAWAAEGGTVITNLDRVGAGRVTLALERVWEGEALKGILRDQPGYMATLRAADEPGASAYGRVMIFGIDAPRRQVPILSPQIERTQPPVLPAAVRGPVFGEQRPAPAIQTPQPGSRRPGVVTPPVLRQDRGEPVVPDAPDPEPAR